MKLKTSMVRSAIDFLSPGGQMGAPGRGTDEENAQASGGGVKEGKTEDKNVANTKRETEEPQLAAPLSLTFKEPEDPLKFLKEQSAIAEDCITIIANKTKESQAACNDVVSQGASADQGELTQKQTDILVLTNKLEIAEKNVTTPHKESNN